MVIHMKIVEEILQKKRGDPDFKYFKIVTIVINLHLQYIPCLKEK